MESRLRNRNGPNYLRRTEIVLLNAAVEEAKPETRIRAVFNLGDELLRRAAAEKKR